jgi:hypothetical protein
MATRPDPCEHCGRVGNSEPNSCEVHCCPGCGRPTTGEIDQLSEEIVTAAEFAIQQVEFLNSADRDGAAQLAQKRAKQLIDLAGISSVMSVVVWPQGHGYAFRLNWTSAPYTNV